MSMLKNTVTMLENFETFLGDQMTIMGTLLGDLGVVYKLFWAIWASHFK